MSKKLKVTFSTEEDEKLVESVAKYPCLYDLSNPTYKDQIAKDNAFKEIAEIVKRSYDDCKTRWRNIKDTHQKRKRRIKGSTGSAAPSRGKKWALAEGLSFLDTVDHKRHDELFSSDDDVRMNESMDIETPVPSATVPQNLVPPNEDMTTRNESPSQSLQYGKGGKKRLNEEILENMRSRREERQEILKSLCKNTEDDLDMFFKSIAMSVRKLSPEFRNEAKSKTLQLVFDLESRENMKSSQQTSTSSSSSSLTAVHNPIESSNFSYPNYFDGSENLVYRKL